MRKVVLTPELLGRVYDEPRFRAALDARQEPDWREQAGCIGVADPDVFFAAAPEMAPPARAVCQQCPVLGECLAEALGRTELDGVWGGTTSAERRSMRAGSRRHETMHAVAS